MREGADGGRTIDGISNFADEETKAQRSDVIGPGSHRLSVPGKAS